MSRPTWDETWMGLAVLMSGRSKCPSGPGAVITDKQQRVVATGYTGPPATYRSKFALNVTTKPGCTTNIYMPVSGEWDCQRDCPRQKMTPDQKPKTYGLECPTVHAEQNAMSFADRSRMEGGSFYISSVPCEACTKMIANSGVVRVLWRPTDADAYRGYEKQVSYLEGYCGLEVEIIDA